MQTRAAPLAAALALVVAAACGSDTTTPVAPKPVKFAASLSPAAEPAVVGTPTGQGTFTATLDTTTNVFTYNVTFSGLTSTVILGHIHGPFTPGGQATTANVILNFDPAVTPGATFVGLNTATSGSATGTVTLNAGTSFTTAVNGDSLKKLLLAGLTYVNIHTTTNKGGEIRAQITVQP
ncbi:MAG: CHRD domain-containing protein [Gemmatimonadales bacterium]